MLKKLKISFCFRASESKLQRLGLPNRSFRMESIATNKLFMEIVFNEFLDRFLLFFGGLGSRFSSFLGLESRILNR